LKNFIAGIVILSFPLLVHAGVFSFFSGLFSTEFINTSEINSQNIALLQAPLNIDPTPFTGGAEITIVGGTALMADNSPSGGLLENEKDHPISDQISIYIVREGDTLSSIAKIFRVSVNTIRWNNDIKGSTISPGQTLEILPVSGVRHEVKKGDTLQSISKLYKADTADIEKYNNISSATKLSIGDIVIVPDGEIVPVSSSSVSPTSRVKIVGSEVSVGTGYFIRPTTGPKTQGIHGYNGVDIAPPAGTPIVAAANGKVIISKTSGWNGGYGVYVVIQHPNGTQTLYSHMSKNVAIQGSQVEQGQVIGYVGSTGKVTGTHLHFEVRGAKNPF
jgi:murein DD-endopeptidase MepM/ murein hydrolase activator NlpD